MFKSGKFPAMPVVGILLFYGLQVNDPSTRPLDLSAPTTRLR